jgi:hypothetical protein
MEVSTAASTNVSGAFEVLTLKRVEFPTRAKFDYLARQSN